MVSARRPKAATRARLALLPAVAVVVALTVAGAASSAQEPGFTDPFDDPALPGWERHGDVSVDDGTLALDAAGFVVRPVPLGTGALRLRVSISGDGVLDIEYHSSDAGGYVLRLVRSGLELIRRRAADDRLLASAALDLPIDSTFDLTVEIGSHEHVVFLGDSEILRARDPEPLPRGGLLLRVGDGAVARFDSVTFEGSDQVEGPPADEAAAVPGDGAEPPPEDLTWIFTGGPPGGLGYDIRMDPRNPDVMYVTDAFAGAFKSIDGGRSWFPISDGITTRAGTSGDAVPVFSLSVDPNDPDRLWAGTQFASDVFRSDDGGETWTLSNSGIEEWGLSIRGLTVQPGDSQVVYLAAEVSSHEWNNEQPMDCYGLDATRGVVYRSDDAGATWRRIWEGDNLARYVWVHPDDPDLLYVSTGIFDRCAANSDPASGERGGVGILRSRDGGATWDALGVGNGIPEDELWFGSLYMHPTDPARLIAASGNGVFPWTEESRQGGIYLTDDGGDTWLEVLDGHAFSGVEICEGDPEVVYAGALSGFFRSDDGGLTWEQTAAALWGSAGIVAGFPIDLQCDPRDPMRIFVNNYNGGNFLSEDGGHTWADASRGYTGALMAQIALVAGDPARLYVSSRGGFFASDDGGSTWRGLGTGIARTLEGLAITVDPFDPLHVIGTLLDAGPYPKVSRDGGETWYGVEPELPDPPHEHTMTRIVFGSRTEGLVLASLGPGACWLARTCPPEAGGGIIRSEDGGETYSATSMDRGNVVALEASPSDDSRWYAYAHPDGLFASRDAGRSWEPVPAQGLPSSGVPEPGGAAPPLIVSLAVDPVDPDRLYAGFSGHRIAISDDGGITWQFATAGLPPETTVLDIAIDPTDPTVVYVATPDSGVYRSVDGGTQWSALNAGLLTRAAEQLALSADGGVLYVTTEGAGVFRLDLAGAPPAPSAAPSEDQPEPSTSAAAQPGAATTEPAPSSAAQAGSGETGPPWILIGAGSAGLAALGAAVSAVLRRRR